MEIQRVDLSSGIVKGGYRVTARDRYALIDSMTAAIARDLRLALPSGSVADATTDSPLAYRLYEEGLRAYYQYDIAAAHRLMQSALAEDSTFAMAAYYLERSLPDGSFSIPERQRALRLAAKAPERERLLITAQILQDNQEPAAVAVAETLTTKFNNDPRSFELLSQALAQRGDWGAAVRAIERAIAMDSASEPPDRQACRLCEDFAHLANVYLWWDSLPAAERTAQRLVQARPRVHSAWDIRARLTAALGDTAALRSDLRRFHEMNPIETSPFYFLRKRILAEEYDQPIRELRELAESPRQAEATEARWLLLIALRNQGRASEVIRLARIEPGPNYHAEALIAIDQGRGRAAAAILEPIARVDESRWPPGVEARLRTWNQTLYGMALAAAGDTAHLRRLADSVEYWGARSTYGRDRRAHHYLRGMLLVAEGRDADAVAELREAIHSPSHGFTRINYELGKALLRLNRPAEAVAVVRAALHGDIDGSNLYMTRTDLHELLAQLFDRLGQRDSAAVHYRAAVRAWERAEPTYQPRRDAARDWLMRYARSHAPGGSDRAAMTSGRGRSKPRASPS